LPQSLTPDIVWVSLLLVDSVVLTVIAAAAKMNAGIIPITKTSF
jgi:hypothetical protein